MFITVLYCGDMLVSSAIAARWKVHACSHRLAAVQEELDGARGSLSAKSAEAAAAATDASLRYHRLEERLTDVTKQNISFQV